MGDDGVNEEVLRILSSLIAFKNKADAKGWRDAFENMPVYLQRVGLENELKGLPVIHVAGTKGKGSTCAMMESILRHAGYRTGLFTSPHLIDVRERIRINGSLVDKESFEQHFWWCYERFNQLATEEIGVPGYFRFITLLALRIFLAKEIDVVILEVGIGGRLDATNVISSPIVCGITALGFDHMEMLGDTLPKIAREKAGILKPSRPAITVPQPEDALEVIKETANSVGAPLEVAADLDSFKPEGGGEDAAIAVSLGGEHQRMNAALAVQLCAAFESDRLDQGKASAGAARRLSLLQKRQVPAEYARGLASTSWPGRSTVYHDPEFSAPESASSTMDIDPSSTQGSDINTAGSCSSRLSFFIDGAHTPESMVTCAEWFAHATRASSLAAGSPEVQRILIFNCMKERDPAILLPALGQSLAACNVHISQAIFVPPESNYGSLGAYKPSLAHVSPAANLTAPVSTERGQRPNHEHDYSWQSQSQQVWEVHCLPQGHGFSAPAAPAPAASSQAHVQARSNEHALSSPDPFPSVPGLNANPTKGAVAHSLASTLDWLRLSVRSQPQLKLQVLVTGSLYLVGDVLRLLGRSIK